MARKKRSNAIRNALTRLGGDAVGDERGVAASSSVEVEVDNDVSNAGESSVLDAGVRFNGETGRAILACNDWLRMGIHRSLADLHRTYQKRALDGETVPSTSLGMMYQWSYKYDWSSRAAMYDTRDNEPQSELAREITSTGLAVPFERVKALKRLAAYLEGYVFDYDHLWPVDWKTSGFGRWAETHKVRNFNSPLLTQYRGVLDDLAKETGGRIKREELSGVGGTPIQIAVGDLDDIRKKIADRLKSLAGESSE